jgi:acetyl-CoA carboxylase carboxyltransferase component
MKGWELAWHGFSKSFNRPVLLFLLHFFRPSGDWGSLPLEGGIEAAYKRHLDEAGSPEARQKLMDDLLDKFEAVRSPIKTANRFGVEEIIDPRDTRPLACEVSNV